jgi:hypothetical protein
MCQRITCSSCGKPGFVGCGRHIEAVLGDVPPAKRCQCAEPEWDEPAAPKQSFLGSLFGRRGGKASGGKAP